MVFSSQSSFISLEYRYFNRNLGETGPKFSKHLRGKTEFHDNRPKTFSVFESIGKFKIQKS